MPSVSVQSCGSRKLPTLLIFLLVTLAQNEIQDPPKKIQGEPPLLGDHGAPHSCLETAQLLAYTLVAGCMSPAPTRKKKGGKDFSFIHLFILGEHSPGRDSCRWEILPPFTFHQNCRGCQYLKFSPEPHWRPGRREKEIPGVNRF